MILGINTILHRSLITAVVLIFVLCACREHKDVYTTIDGQAQGTTFHIVYRDSLARDFSQDIDSIFRLIDRSMSLWDSTSVISRINNGDSTVIPDEHFIQVLTKANQVSAMTRGAFDVTVGPLVRAWGFSFKGKAPFPDSTTVIQLKKKVGYQNVALDQNKIVKAVAGVQLDFNGIAQGYTVDLICRYLQNQGIRDCLVEIGGEVRAHGQNEQGMIWQVGIDKPVDTLTTGRPLQEVIALHDKALATSGSYRHFQVKDGLRLSHVIDPATGYPVSHNLVSVSVLADDCTTADAYATAFLVMGIEKAMALATEKGMELYAVYADENGELKTKATSGFLK